jgi:hypothetical protein
MRSDLGGSLSEISEKRNVPTPDGPHRIDSPHEFGFFARASRLGPGKAASTRQLSPGVRVLRRSKMPQSWKLGTDLLA